jgi:hypothetical protein
MATMPRPTKPVKLGDPKIVELRHLLRQRGLDDADFEIVEDQRSGIGQLLGMAGGIVSVRRQSTGELRVYAAGAGASWLAAIAADLDRGYFRTPGDGTQRPRKATGGGSMLWFF